MANEVEETVQGEPLVDSKVTNAPAQETVSEVQETEIEVAQTPERSETTTVFPAHVYFCYMVRFNKSSI